MSNSARGEHTNSANLGASVRQCLVCGAHVPMVAGALRCEDCGGPQVPPGELRRLVQRMAGSRFAPVAYVARGGMA